MGNNTEISLSGIIGLYKQLDSLEDSRLAYERWIEDARFPISYGSRSRIETIGEAERYYLVQHKINIALTRVKTRKTFRALKKILPIACPRYHEKYLTQLKVVMAAWPWLNQA